MLNHSLGCSNFSSAVNLGQVTDPGTLGFSFPITKIKWDALQGFFQLCLSSFPSCCPWGPEHFQGGRKEFWHRRYLLERTSSSVRAVTTRRQIWERKDMKPWTPNLPIPQVHNAMASIWILNWKFQPICLNDQRSVNANLNYSVLWQTFILR